MPLCRYICLTWVSHCQEKVQFKESDNISADFGCIAIGICHNWQCRIVPEMGEIIATTGHEESVLLLKLIMLRFNGQERASL
ncbi:hypothetical protein HAX54_037101 [Datura stramonium]|uniref:Uncharacterized protein n=1 Tax=Datura stramonium TaxID=4076 RepID=A0ABS8SHQ6_DATST|nr:hypothetical protein [Datura stramonium]